MQLLLNSPLLSHFVRLDTIVTTVDAVNAPQQLNEHAEAVKQAAIADRLLMTKTDLGTANAATQLRARLAHLNPGAAIETVQFGEIDPDRLFGAALFDPDRKTTDVRRWINETAYEPHDDHNHHHHHAHDHDREIHAFCMAFDDPLDWMAVSDWLGAIRRERGDGLLRVKGILHLAGESAPVAIHGVHHVFHPPVRLSAWPDEDRRSRIVFITRGLERQDLEESWRRHSAALASTSG